MPTLPKHVFPIAILTMAASLPGQAVVTGHERLTLEQTVGRGAAVEFVPRPPNVRWADDGRSVEVVEETAAPRGGRRARGDAAPRVQVRDGDLYLAGGEGEPRRLTTDGGAKREAHASPDGRLVSFVRGGNLAILAVADGALWNVSGDGSDDLLYGVLDWVYQEEVYGRGDFQGHWWSPDSARVAFLRIDEAPVKKFTVIDHVPTDELARERSVVAETTSYPKAGDPNPVVGLGVADVAARSVAWIDLAARYPKAEELLIVRVGWLPDGSRVVFQVQNRIQTWLDLLLGDPTTGKVTTLVRERSDTWVNVLGQPHWLQDGTFLWQSERTGHNHVYRYSADGELVGTVTRGDWPVRDILRVDERQGLLWFAASGDSAIDRHAYRVRLDGTEQIRLTRGAGTHEVTLDHDGSQFLDRYQSVSVMPEVRLCGRDGEVVKTWNAKAAPDIDRYGLVRRELHAIVARDGHLLDASLIRPVGFDAAGGPYPVFLETYSGPDAPTVRNTWSYSAWHQFLAQEGYLVFQVNVRSASGRGQVATGACYKQFGVQELRDLEDGVAWLGANARADLARVGISGWSYGGFMAAYALTHGKAFALGIAGAGVYDWQLYDTIYTERYMDTPQANPHGYAASSCLTAAKDLHGHLVLLHGTMDDNVHLQNAIRFVYELQQAGKQFDLMLYPRSRHGVRSAEQRWHMRELTWRAIERWLGDGARRG